VEPTAVERHIMD